MRMLTALKKNLVIILALLQSIAPLVHAHTSEQTAVTGLHIPGLEFYSDAQTLPEIQALAQALTDECLIIGIDSGIRQESGDCGADRQQDQVCLIGQDTLTKHQVLLRHQVNFSPHRLHFLSLTFALSPLTPRAPPSLN
ncbi:MAG: hypothetical protein ACU85E_10375 [Gammaproteobacteria bacterium]